MLHSKFEISALEAVYSAIPYYTKQQMLQSVSVLFALHATLANIFQAISKALKSRLKSMNMNEFRVHI